jgi:hypothetical protein
MNRKFHAFKYKPPAICVVFGCVLMFSIQVYAIEIDEYEIIHNGLLQSKKESNSLRGIGDSILRFNDYELAVDGQFQIVGSSAIVQKSIIGRSKKIIMNRTIISIVASGDVKLRIFKSGEVFTGKTAVYHVGKKTWSIDGLPLKKYQ